MGLPEGHVTGVKISRNDQLKALGNGVVPQQAAAMWLRDIESERVAWKKLSEIQEMAKSLAIVDDPEPVGAE